MNTQQQQIYSLDDSIRCALFFSSLSSVCVPSCLSVCISVIFVSLSHLCTHSACCRVSDECKTPGDPWLLLIFGPSASGKTTAASKCIPDLLKENKVNHNDIVLQLMHLSSNTAHQISEKVKCFISVDGGLMRKKSLVWQKWSKLCRASRHDLGCKQLCNYAITHNTVAMELINEFCFFRSGQRRPRRK